MSHISATPCTMCSSHIPPAITHTYVQIQILQDRSLRLWNPHKGFDIKVYKGHGYEVRDVSVSTDNSQMASAGGDRQLFLWDVASGNVIRKFRGHDARINTVRNKADSCIVLPAKTDCKSSSSRRGAARTVCRRGQCSQAGVEQQRMARSRMAWLWALYFCMRGVGWAAVFLSVSVKCCRFSCCCKSWRGRYQCCCCCCCCPGGACCL